MSISTVEIIIYEKWWMRRDMFKINFAASSAV
jgi:hypothetical protein